MKKTVLSIMVVAMSLFTFNAMAQGKKCDKQQDCKKEACDKHKPCDKKMRRNCPNPFEGIELTKAQQEKLDALKASCPLNNKKEECKKQRHNKDSMMRVAKSNHLAQVKSILTPEQYVQFLENMVLNAPDKAPKHRPHGMRPGTPHKGNCSAPQGCPKK